MEGPSVSANPWSSLAQESLRPLWRVVVLSLLIYFAFPCLVKPQDVPNTPVLRLETGRHTSRITEISTDFASRYAVTASVDKTARIWDLATGELISILRPPIGFDTDGML